MKQCEFVNLPMCSISKSYLTSEKLPSVQSVTDTQ